MARIAIAGGTGFVGIHAGRALSAAGHQVRLLARGTRRGPRPAGTEVVRADVTRREGLAEALAGCDVVLSLTAVIREKGGQTFERVNVEGVRNVALAAREAGVGHLIHLGALGAGPDPRFAYLASKWAGEQAVTGAGVPYTVLRPSLMFGPGDGFFTLLTRLVRLNPVIPIVGDGRAMFQPLAIDDMARIITICVDRGASNSVHEVGGPQYMTYEQIVDVIKAEIGVHRLKAHVPVPMMLPVAMVMEKVLPNPPVTPGQLRMLERPNITRTDAVPTQFGFEPLVFADNCDYLNDY